MTKDSRLEKFLKALCSLDYSDLPTPLSRVEVLWNCLITGEATPDFQPQSRTEKYLMTILGVYDLEDIPKPISRAETLLYKLATGDTDVELEDGAKSRYERLLSEIITNGGVGGNVDFEYVTYILTESLNTLYNTVEAPVKSAILKGRTLVNLCNRPKDHVTLDKNTPIADLNITRELQAKKYAIIGEVSDFNAPNIGVSVWVSHSDGEERYYNKLAYTNGKFVYLLEAQKEITTVKVYIHEYDRENDGFFSIGGLMLLEYQDGMENWDIPYFEGMKSVQMPVLTTTGKNLFDGELELGTLSSGSGEPSDNDKCLRSKNFINVSPNTSYVFSNDLGYTTLIFQYDKNKQLTIGGTIADSITTKENTYYVKFRTAFGSVQNDLSVKYQVEKRTQITQPTSYEPYKSNILTVNEEVHLHKIGDVQDELNLITGELTQRIGEVVLYGSENWGMNMPTEEYSKPTIRVSCDKLIKGGYASGIKLISDKIPVGFAGLQL